MREGCYDRVMTYMIRGLDPMSFAHLFNLSDGELEAQGAKRVTADAYPGYPCRIMLDDLQPGKTLLLVNHVSHQGGPYHASHAIFVGEGQGASAQFVDQVPPALDRRILSIRAFDENGMMIDAALAQPGEANAVIHRLLDNPEVHHLDAHNATRGCFAARVDRDRRQPKSL